MHGEVSMGERSGGGGRGGTRWQHQKTDCNACSNSNYCLTSRHNGRMNNNAESSPVIARHNNHRV